MKVIFPCAWIAIFGLGTVRLWIGAIEPSGGDAPSPAMKWQFLTMWIAGAAFLWWACAGLKRVRTDSKYLYVSNYRQEISVPVHLMEDVTENRWINIHPVTIHFKADTEFGSSITFMPTQRLFGLFRSHPVVAELKQLAGLPRS
jgi:hypothetical protein